MAGVTPEVSIPFKRETPSKLETITPTEVEEMFSIPFKRETPSKLNKSTGLWQCLYTQSFNSLQTGNSIQTRYTSSGS